MIRISAFYVLLALIFGNVSYSNSQICLTEYDSNNSSSNISFKPGEGVFANGPYSKPKRLNRIVENTHLVFKINLVIITKEPAIFEIVNKDFNESLSFANELYSNADVGFEISKRLSVNDFRFVIFNKDDKEQEQEIIDLYHKSGYINIFLVPDIDIQHKSDEFDDITGYTFFPWTNKGQKRKELIILSHGAADEKNVLAHELGHFFGLYHTHETHEGLKRETVNRTNCHLLGDYICGTEADPGLLKLVDLVNGQWTYIGKARDAFGDLYRPDIKNIMSYAPSRVRSELVKQQFNVIRKYCLEKTLYLKFKRNKIDGDPFDIDVESDIINNEVMSDLGGAAKAYDQSVKSRFLLLYVYDESSYWSKRMYDELIRTDKFEDIRKYVTVVVFQNEETIIDEFLKSDLFKDYAHGNPYYNLLRKQLMTEVTSSPSVFLLEFGKRFPSGDIQIIYQNLGYLKPRILRKRIKKRAQKNWSLSAF